MATHKYFWKNFAKLCENVGQSPGLIILAERYFTTGIFIPVHTFLFSRAPEDILFSSLIEIHIKLWTGSLSAFTRWI